MRFLRTSIKRLRGTVFLRLDFNTEDEWRMHAVLPTIQLLLLHRHTVVIGSHRGRPEGPDPKWSLKKNARDLSKMLGRRVVFLPLSDFPALKKKIAAAPQGTLFMLENLRFDAREEKNSSAFARSLASLADAYVNDAFAVSHRDDASIVAITKFLPSYAGLELEREVHFLRASLSHPAKPFVVILGGGKATDKLGVIEFFKKKADTFLLGGAPANTIAFLRGAHMKQSIIDHDPADLARLKRVATFKNIRLPVAYIWSNNRAVDIAAASIKDFGAAIAGAKTILWSGPMGVIEHKPYDRGTLAVARAIAKNRRALTIAGGGETVMFLKKHRLDKQFSFVSTGGGAMVDFLAGEILPGIKALG